MRQGREVPSPRRRQRPRESVTDNCSVIGLNLTKIILDSKITGHTSWATLLVTLLHHISGHTPNDYQSLTLWKITGHTLGNCGRTLES